MKHVARTHTSLDEGQWQALLQWLYAQLPMYQRQGAPAMKKDLTPIRQLMDRLGHPHRQWPAIHVAGTNGKGSVSHMLAALFQAMGWRTGLYTSPHLLDFRERIRVDGQMVAREWVHRFVHTHQSAFTSIRPSFFEISVAMAFQYFAERQVDMAIVETGLGGRLDSTNILQPHVSVITHIGKDHQQFLGETLEQIAAEKAGIIKRGCPVVVGQRQPSIDVVFCRKAQQLNAPITFATDTWKVRFRKTAEAGQYVDIWHAGQLWLPNLYLDLGGRYQLKNLATALATWKQWATMQGIDWADKALIRQAMGQVRTTTGLRGRWEVLGQNPLIIGDVAHNVDGLAAVWRQLQALPYQTLHVVLGMVRDKRLEEVLPLFPRAAHYYFTCPDIPRGLDAKQLQRAAATFGLRGEVWPSVVAAYEAAKATAGKSDLIFVGGSTFVLAEILARL